MLRALSRRPITTVILSGLVCLILISVAVLQFDLGRGSKQVALTITAGSEHGLRHQIASSLGDALAPLNVNLNLRATAGSNTAMHAINAGEIELGLIQGGLRSSPDTNLRQVAVLHVEPLHLLISPQLAESAGDSGHLSQLRGRRVNLSNPGSGTYALAQEVLQFAGLKPSDLQIMQASYEDLLAPRISADELPEAVFTVSSLPSPVAQHLIREHGFRAVHLPLADAIRMHWRLEPESTVIRQRLVDAKIPAMLYQVDPPCPAETIHTLGTRLHLVAHRDVDADKIERVVETIYASSFSQTSDPPLNIELLRTNSEFPLHAGTQLFLHKNTPVVTEHMVELTEQVLAIVGAICGAVLFVWQAIIYARRKRRDRQFLNCVERVGEIEAKVLQYERDDEMTIKDLLQLQEELTTIKNEMVQQFQSGDIEGAETLSGFLMHINDAHENVMRVLLHERDPLHRSGTPAT